MAARVHRLHCEPWLPGATALRAYLLAAVLLLAAAASASGQQHMRGRLLDVDSNEPVAAGHLQLLALDSTVVASTMSDAQGNWRLEVPRPGRYFVAARHPGYQSWTSAPVDIAAGDQLNAVFHIKRAAVRLDPLEVRAEAVRQYLETSGFFERQRSNFGHFVTPEAIEKRQAARVTDLLTAIPGVQRVALAGGSVGPAQIQLRGSSLSQGGLCRPRIFVDGLMYSTGDSRPIRRNDADATERAEEDLLRRMDQAISLDDLGHPSIIAGIEVYRSASQVPVQFGGTSVDTLCGVIVIWTHTGRMRAGERS
ncbi:MAG TPA: carboxypeptidase regulatory-like domain-containing protein [Longimicrobiales bacterium]|nr:carboxypeptidase regulatory-like domain-containing protein [Longimicrobiales bacterium]